MKKAYLLTALLLFAWQMFAQDSKKPLQKLVETQLNEGHQFEKLALFLLDKTVQKPGIEKVIRKADFYHLSKTALKTVTEKQPKRLMLDLQTPSGKLQLQLLKHQLFTTDFALKTSSEENGIDFKPGQHYRGTVQGQPNSVVAISIFEEEVVGIISLPQNGNFILGKMQDSKNGLHIGYYEADLLVASNVHCDTPEPAYTRNEIQILQQLANTVPTSRSNNCVNVYLELEHELVKGVGDAASAANFITGLFNVVATFYQNENITTQISEIFAWDVPDSYPTSSTLAVLQAFSLARQTFNGDLAHLVSWGAPAGGRGYIDGLCNDHQYAYSNIDNDYDQYPTYSWSVNIMTHEMGHNLGSPHTHNCSWPGGAIDGCGPTAGYPEGCSGPIPPQGGGTIMSYCHLLPSVGIDFQNGFGALPGNLIRNKVATALCLSPCEQCPTDLLLSGTENGAQIYEADNTITSTQVLTTTANVSYNAGVKIQLTPGFTANYGTDFHAYIAACSSNFSPENQGETQANEDNVALEDAVPQTANKYSFRSYPNPFSKTTSLEYHLETDGPVNLVITDLTGRLVKQLVKKNQTSGVYNLTFDAAELPAGMYLASLQVNGKVKTIKLLVMDE